VGFRSIGGGSRESPRRLTFTLSTGECPSNQQQTDVALDPGEDLKWCARWWIQQQLPDSHFGVAENLKVIFPNGPHSTYSLSKIDIIIADTGSMFRNAPYSYLYF